MRIDSNAQSSFLSWTQQGAFELHPVKLSGFGICQIDPIAQNFQTNLVDFLLFLMKRIRKFFMLEIELVNKRSESVSEITLKCVELMTKHIEKVAIFL
jgi:hypothetical protein